VRGWRCDQPGSTAGALQDVLDLMNQHSETGVMKARWTHQDYMEMGQKPISFTEQDIALIHSVLAARTNTARLIAAPAPH
jgi:hypothetical protein